MDGNGLLENSAASTSDSLVDDLSSRIEELLPTTVLPSV